MFFFNARGPPRRRRKRPTPQSGAGGLRGSPAPPAPLSSRSSVLTSFWKCGCSLMGPHSRHPALPPPRDGRLSPAEPPAHVFPRIGTTSRETQSRKGGALVPVTAQRQISQHLARRLLGQARGPVLCPNSGVFSLVLSPHSQRPVLMPTSKRPCLLHPPDPKARGQRPHTSRYLKAAEQDPCLF